MIYFECDKQSQVMEILKDLVGVAWTLEKPLGADFSEEGLSQGLVLSSPRKNYLLALDKRINIAVDGPSGSGKSTVARALADKLRIQYLDTGAMYRAFTYYLIQEGFSFEEKLDLEKAFQGFSLSYRDNQWYLNGQVLGDEIRQEAVNERVSLVASLKEVRDYMSDLQRKLSKENSSILDGRDIGTVVLPQAHFKFFLDADPEVRAQRRSVQLGEKDVEKMKKQLLKRDQLDSSRAIAPLKQAADAILIDNSNETLEETVDRIYQRICRDIHVV